MGSDIGGDLPLTPPTDPELMRPAAVRIADQIAAEHPHPLDELYPALAGQVIAKDPAVRAEVADLFNLLGIEPAQVRKAAS